MFPGLFSTTGWSIGNTIGYIMHGNCSPGDTFVHQFNCGSIEAIDINIIVIFGMYFFNKHRHGFDVYRLCFRFKDYIPFTSVLFLDKPKWNLQDGP